jgi:hypothetical protein
MSDSFDDLLERAKALKPGDESGLKAIIVEALAADISEARCETLVCVAATATKISRPTVRRLFAEAREAAKQPVQETPSADAQPDAFPELLARAKALSKGDDAGLKALIDGLLAESFSDERRDLLVRTMARASGFTPKLVNVLVAEAKRELDQRQQDTKEAQDAARLAAEEKLRRLEAEAEAARTVREAERERLRKSCSEIATSKTLLADMETLVHRMGVVGESAAIRGAYLAATSRLLKTFAISLLMRGAPASGKNHLIKKILRLIPEASVIEISSATPMALIYLGVDVNDVDVLKHKVLLIEEAAILARKANGDEHPMTAMLRILLSEGKLNHHLAVPQPRGMPKTVHIRRNGPVSLFLTSARENIEEEMLTRLLSSDADESVDQTLNVVDNVLSNSRETVSQDGIERWRDFQRSLELDMPQGGYDVAIPFSEAISKSYRELTGKSPNALQLRMRRDVAALKAAVQASAILFKAQRQKDAEGRIIAEIVDYEAAHGAFNEGMAALYDLKPTEAVVATLVAVVEIAKGGDLKLDGAVSHKIPLTALRKRLGVSSNTTAGRRLAKVIEFGAVEEDESKRGKGRGSPRYYKIKTTKMDRQAINVFPPTEDVKRLFEAEATSGADQAFLVHLRGKPVCTKNLIDNIGDSASCTHGVAHGDEPSDSRAKKKLNGASTTRPEDVVAAARGAGVVFHLADAGDVFTVEWRGPLDPLISDAIRANYEGVLDVLRRESAG